VGELRSKKHFFFNLFSKRIFFTSSSMLMKQEINKETLNLSSPTGGQGAI